MAGDIYCSVHGFGPCNTTVGNGPCVMSQPNYPNMPCETRPIMRREIDWEELTKMVVDVRDMSARGAAYSRQFNTAADDENIRQFCAINRLACRIAEEIGLRPTGHEEPRLPLDLEPVARARASDPSTSKMAAANLDPKKIRENQRTILVVIGREGALGTTDEEIFARLPQPWSRSGARTRRKELQRMGLVENTGCQRPLSSGNKGTVWGITDTGRELWRRSAKSLE